MILILAGVPDQTAITLPLVGFFGNVRVDWGDSTITEDTVDHTYTNTVNTNYTIKITQTFDEITGFYNPFGPWNGSQYLTTIQQWGNFPSLTDINSIGGAALISVPNVLPSTVTNIARMFFDASNFNDPNIITWDVSRVLDMNRMFVRASIFNQPIGSWNVSQVTDMERMFIDATAFNQDISSWDVSEVTNMDAMFQNNGVILSPFNQDISNWNVGKVEKMIQMFSGTSFNQNLGRWNVSSVFDMQFMFIRNTAYDTLNYSATLNGWADISGTLLPNDPNRFSLRGGDSIYESARAAYTTLTSAPINWVIRPIIGDEFGTPLIVNPTPELEFQYNMPTTREYSQGMTINPYIPVFASLYSDVQFQISPISPPLPEGLVIDPTTGRISGTPTVAAAAATYTIKATANAGTVIQDFPIILSVINVISYIPDTYVFLNNVQIVPITPTVNPATTIISYTITPAMTSGLVFNTTTGIITGTPTSFLNQTYSISATTSTGITLLNSINIAVNDIRYTTTAFTFLAGVAIRPINPTFDPITLQPGVSSTFAFQAPAPAGLTIGINAGTINGTMNTAASSGTYNVVISLTTELTTYMKTVPLTFTVSVITYTPTTYSFLAGIPIQTINPVLTPPTLTGATFVFQTTPTGLTIGNTTGSITGTMNNVASSGTYNVVITFSNYTKTVPLTFTVVSIAYTLTTYSFLAKATIVPIQPVLTPPTLTGATFAFQAPSPSGLTIGNTSGIITGAMPTNASSTTYNVVITLTTNVATYTKPVLFTFTVSSITYNPTTYNFLAGIAIETIQPIIPTYSAQPDSITYTGSNLPNGLAVNTTTGFITGTPASESAGTNTAVISVLNAGVVLNTNSLAMSVLELIYNPLAYTFTATVPITTISPSSSYLTGASTLTFAPPANLLIDASGNITGTPLAAAPETTYNLTLTVANTTYQKTIPFSFTVINFIEPLILQFGSIPTNFQLSLPLIGITGNFAVEWGDGSPTTINIYNYTYTNSGFANYTVKIRIQSGILLGFGSIDWAGSAFLTSIDEWGVLPGISALNYIGGAMLTNVPPVLPTTITDLSYMFYQASKFNQPIGIWDVSQITTMAYMFNQATNFNQNLGGWRINNVSNMTRMFF